MMNWAPVQALNAAELADLAAYIASNLPANNPMTTTNTPVTIDLSHHITLTGQAWSAFTSIEIVTPPAHGSLARSMGRKCSTRQRWATLARTPSPIAASAPACNDGDPQTITITINPPAPGISSALSASATFGAPFSYQITATGSPTSFAATGLPAGLTVDTMTGAITGTPTTTGSFVVDVAATNAGARARQLDARGKSSRSESSTSLRKHRRRGPTSKTARLPLRQPPPVGSRTIRLSMAAARLSCVA